jgi:hypothetical protein
LPADARVASFDIGAIGYFSERPILDLGALVEPNAIGFLRKGTTVEKLREERITHVVLPRGQDADFPDLSNFAFRLRLQDNPAIELQPIHSFESDRETYLRGALRTQNATFRQVVETVTFTDCAAVKVESQPQGRFLLEGLESPPRPTARRLETAFAEAASRGLCVRASTLGKPASAAGCWSFFVADPIELTAPDAAGEEEERSARAVVSDWALPFVHRGDMEGAAGAALHALARLTRQRFNRCFWTPLPVLEKPEPGIARGAPPPRSTLWWGVPLALMVAMLAASLTSRVPVPSA